MNTVRDVDDSILEQARALLPYIRLGGHLGTRLTTLGDIPEMFVHLFELITMETIPEDKKPFGSRRDQATTLQTILDTLEQHLQLPLSHISGWGLVTSDRRQTADALQIFTDLVTEIVSLGQTKMSLREMGDRESSHSMFTPPISTQPLPHEPVVAQRDATANEEHCVRQLNFTDESTDGAASYSSLRRNDLDEERPNNGRRPDIGDACQSSTSSTTHVKQTIAKADDVTTLYKHGPYRGNGSQTCLQENNSLDRHLGGLTSEGEHHKGSDRPTQLKLHTMAHGNQANRSLKEKEYSTSALHSLNDNAISDARQNMSANRHLRAGEKAKYKKDKTQLREKLEPYKKPIELSVKMKFNLKDSLPPVKETTGKVYSDSARFAQSKEPRSKPRQNSTNKGRNGMKLRELQTDASLYTSQTNAQRRKPFVVGALPNNKKVEQAAKIRIRNPSVKIRKPSVKRFSPVKRVLTNSTAGKRSSSNPPQRTLMTASVNNSTGADDAALSHQSQINRFPHGRRMSVVSTKVRKLSNGASVGKATGRYANHSVTRTLPPNRDGRRNSSDESKSRKEYEAKNGHKHYERGPPSPQTTSLCASLKLLEEFDFVKRRLKQIRIQRHELLQSVRELDAEKIRLEHVMSHVRENAALTVTEVSS